MIKKIIFIIFLTIKKVLETFICKYVEDIKDFDFSPYLANKNIYAIILKSTNKLIGIILYFDETQESFFGHMKDEIGSRVKACELYIDLVKIIDKYMDYYNNYRYQWNLAKLSPNEYYKFCMTGEYPNDYKE